MAAGQGSVGTFFADIHIDRIVLAVVLFVIVQIIRVIIVKIIKGIVEINMLGFKIINRILGMAFMFAVALAILLVVFQIVAWVGGDTAANFAANSTAACSGWMPCSKTIPSDLCSAAELPRAARRRRLFFVTQTLSAAYNIKAPRAAAREEVCLGIYF